jgi:hypothetical protein
MKMTKQSRDMKIINPFNRHETINQFKRGEDDQPVQERMKMINQFDSDENGQPIR